MWQTPGGPFKARTGFFIDPSLFDAGPASARGGWIAKPCSRRRGLHSGGRRRLGVRSFAPLIVVFPVGLHVSGGGEPVRHVVERGNGSDIPDVAIAETRFA